MLRRDLLKLSVMLGISAISTSVASAIQAGVSSATKSAGALTQAQRSAVTLLAEMIIPSTDTPGAIEAGVPVFIESIYSDWYKDQERAIFNQGLEALDKFCQAKDGKTFIAAAMATRISALQAQERESAAFPRPEHSLFGSYSGENSPFFLKIKELVVLGYYTSKVGATQELHYLPMPMKFDGNYPVTEKFRQWSQ